MSERRIAVVTGANRGLGLETARRLAVAGHRVVMTSRNEASGRAAAGDLAEQGLDVMFQPLDVQRPESVQRLAAHLAHEFGRLDVLVNNAGIFGSPGSAQAPSVSVFETDLGDLRTTLDTNLVGPFLLCQALIPLMLKANWGRVVNVSSTMGQLEGMGGGWAPYRISKAGLNAVTRVFAAELVGTNVKVNSVCPGWVRTEMGGPHATLSIAEGVDTIVWAATLPDDGPSGVFLSKRQPIAW